MADVYKLFGNDLRDSRVDDIEQTFGGGHWQRMPEIQLTEPVTSLVFGTDEEPLLCKDFIVAFGGVVGPGQGDIYGTSGDLGYYLGLLSANCNINIIVKLQNGNSFTVNTKNITKIGNRSLIIGIYASLGISTLKTDFASEIDGTIGFVPLLDNDNKIVSVTLTPSSGNTFMAPSDGKSKIFTAKR